LKERKRDSSFATSKKGKETPFLPRFKQKKIWKKEKVLPGSSPLNGAPSSGKRKKAGKKKKEGSTLILPARAAGKKKKRRLQRLRKKRRGKKKKTLAALGEPGETPGAVAPGPASRKKRSKKGKKRRERPLHGWRREKEGRPVCQKKSP